MNFTVENIARWIINRRVAVLIIVCAVTVLSIIGAARLKISNDLSIWLKRSSVEYSRYMKFITDFGNDESIILIYHSDSLATNSHLKLNWQLTDSLRNLSGVANVISLATIKVPSSSLGGPSVLPLLPKSMSNPSRLAERLMHYQTYTDFLFSTDFKTTSFVIIPDSGADRQSVIRNIESLADVFLNTAGTYVIFGIVPLKESLRKLSVNESAKFLSITIALIFLMNLFIFRRIGRALMPLLIALLTIIWILGLMSATGTSVNVVTSILPIVLIVLSIANSIHFITGQIRSDRLIADRKLSVINNFAGKYKKCFFSSITTAVALFAFGFSDITPLRQFGIFASIGVILSFILTFIILPVIFSYSNFSRSDFITDFFVLKGKNRFAEVIFARRIRIYIVSGIFLVLSIAGILRLQVNTDQVTYFRKHHKIRFASEKASEWYRGVLPLELVFALDSSFYLSPHSHISRMSEFENRFEEIPSIKAWESVVTILRDYNLTSTGNNPFLSISWVDIKRERELMSHFISDDGKSIRTTIRTSWLNDREEIELLDKLRSIFSEYFSDTGVNLYFTGMAPVFAHLSSRLVKSQIRSFSFTFLVIFLMFLFLFRSIRMALLYMLPNVLPVASTIGIMGVLNIPLDVATVMIATVSFGIAVDNTIHLTLTFKDLLAGTDKLKALNVTIGIVGKPLVATSVLLTVGFLSMLFSSYRPIAFMGLFLSINILLALVCDLILLPALLLSGKK